MPPRAVEKPARPNPVFMVFLTIWLVLLTLGFIGAGALWLMAPAGDHRPLIAWMGATGIGIAFGLRLRRRALNPPPPGAGRPMPPRESGPGESEKGFD